MNDGEEFVTAVAMALFIGVSVVDVVKLVSAVNELKSGK